MEIREEVEDGNLVTKHRARPVHCGTQIQGKELDVDKAEINNLSLICLQRSSSKFLGSIICIRAKNEIRCHSHVCRTNMELQLASLA